MTSPITASMLYDYRKLNPSETKKLAESIQGLFQSIEQK
jgi:hypothetical protein